ncbi:flagellar basal-body rod protein FlgG [Peribacillus deserti]|uniref:Flagellar basal-body rod protein FlgG n=1 Tax=Peribacillus deserti TaxID=673318 RepID=A0ABS2QDF3_9BACI|nr:flagellar hook-basal body protein [Peribacillus deserti]MBM7690709.1 flagellar basal-body rod protein FlgG [Peribacillus deserti]
MLRGFYTAASGMLSQQRRTEMLTNNISNASTPGFKADQSSMRAFPKMFLNRVESLNIPVENKLTLPTSKNIGNLSTGVYMQEAMPDFGQGDITETQRSTDIALQDMTTEINPETGRPGTALFSVSNANGEIRYTRNGNFTLDAAGFLTAPGGNYVLDDTGNRIQLQSENFTVGEDGVIQENDQRVSRLGIMYTDDPYGLVKEGDGLFRAEGGQNIQSAYEMENVPFKLQQGFIEQSNVDASRTMTDMLTAYRAFEANQKVLQAYDKSMDKAVNEIGRIG